MLFLAVVVRETGRGLVVAYYGLPVSGLLLLPTGGLQTLQEGAESAAGRARAGEPKVQKALALAGPVANVLFGLTVAGIVMAMAPATNLLEMKWVTPAHLLRGLVWVNLLLAGLHFLPVWPLDGGRVMEQDRPAGGIPAGPMVATALVAVGMATVNFWLMMAGIGLFLAVQAEKQGAALKGGGDTVKVREVMLTEYSILSASATLEDAVEQSRHTLQDVFPVVRAGNMVGGGEPGGGAVGAGTGREWVCAGDDVQGV